MEPLAGKFHPTHVVGSLALFLPRRRISSPTHVVCFTSSSGSNKLLVAVCIAAAANTWPDMGRGLVHVHGTLFLYPASGETENSVF